MRLFYVKKKNLSRKKHFQILLGSAGYIRKILFPLQQQISNGCKDVQAVDHIRRDAGVEAVGVLHVALAEDAVGVGRYFLHYFQRLKLAQHVQDLAAHRGRRARGELLAREAQLDARAWPWRHSPGCGW